MNDDAQFGDGATAALKIVGQPKIASELVLAEVLCHQKLEGETIYSKATYFLQSLDVEWIPVSREILIEAARLRRQKPKLHLADAIHIATAVLAGAEQFMTCDKELAKHTGFGILIKSL